MVTCQACQKADATVHLTTMVNCRPSERHYCGECALTANLYAPMSLKGATSPPRTEGPEPPQEAWLSDQERSRLMCPDCRHVNQNNWNYCSACGSLRRP